MSQGEPVCLNCGSKNVGTFCADCGQQHIEAEAFGVAGLAGDYSRHTFGKLKLLANLWTLFRHPGELTVEFVAGKRVRQVNPLVVFLFVWTTTVTISHFFLRPESADALLALVDVLRAQESGSLDTAPFWDAYMHTATRYQPFILAASAYTLPVGSVLASTVFSRATTSAPWLRCWVFALHLGAVSLLIMFPISLLVALGGLFSWVAFVTIPVSVGAQIGVWIYSWLSFRRVFGDRVEGVGLRWMVCALSTYVFDILAALLVVWMTFFPLMAFTYYMSAG